MTSRQTRAVVLPSFTLMLVVLTVVRTLAQAAPSVVEYYHLDALGSLRAVTDSSGTLIRLHDFKPFGEEVTSASVADEHLFTGQERDHSTGLDYFGARYYRPDLGRFTTVDPGHVNGDAGDPESWNPYGSVRNNPLRYTDPSGTHYFIDVYSGSDFWVDTDVFSELGRFAYPYSLVGNFNQGEIRDSDGRKLGTYQYSALFEYTVWQAGWRSQPAVDLAEAALAAAKLAAAFWAPTAVAAAGFDCVVEGKCGIGMLAAAVPFRAGRVLPSAARRTTSVNEVFRRLQKFHGIDPALASTRLHQIKAAFGRGGADNVVFDLTGNVYDPVTGAWLGSLTQGGARAIR